LKAGKRISKISSVKAIRKVLLNHLRSGCGSQDFRSDLRARCAFVEKKGTASGNDMLHQHDRNGFSRADRWLSEYSPAQAPRSTAGSPARKIIVLNVDHEKSAIHSGSLLLLSVCAVPAGRFRPGLGHFIRPSDLPPL
jgi:hypothetical protein